MHIQYFTLMLGIMLCIWYCIIYYSVLCIQSINIWKMSSGRLFKCHQIQQHKIVYYLVLGNKCVMSLKALNNMLQSDCYNSTYSILADITQTWKTEKITRTLYSTWELMFTRKGLAATLALIRQGKEEWVGPDPDWKVCMRHPTSLVYIMAD